MKPRPVYAPAVHSDDETDPDESDPDETDPDESDPDGSDPDESDPDESDPDESDPDDADFANEMDASDDEDEEEDKDDFGSASALAAAYRAEQSSEIHMALYKSRDVSVKKVADGNRGLCRLHQIHGDDRDLIREEVMRGQPDCPAYEDMEVALETAKMLSEALGPKFARVLHLVGKRGVPTAYKCGATVLDVVASFLVCKIKEVSQGVLKTVANVHPLHDALTASSPSSETWLPVILSTTGLLKDEMDNMRFMRLLLFGACTALTDAAAADADGAFRTVFFRVNAARLFAVPPRKVGGSRSNASGYYTYGATRDSPGEPDKSTVRVTIRELRVETINGTNVVAQADTYYAHIKKATEICKVLDAAVDEFSEIGVCIDKRAYMLLTRVERVRPDRRDRDLVYEYVECKDLFTERQTLGDRCAGVNINDKITLYVRYLSSDPAEMARELAEQAPLFDPLSVSEIKVVANGAAYDMPMPLREGDEDALVTFLAANLDPERDFGVKLFTNKKKIYKGCKLHRAGKALAARKAAAFTKKTGLMAKFIKEKVNTKHSGLWGEKQRSVMAGIRKGVHVTLSE